MQFILYSLLAFLMSFSKPNFLKKSNLKNNQQSQTTGPHKDPFSNGGSGN